MLRTIAITVFSLSIGLIGSDGSLDRFVGRAHMDRVVANNKVLSTATAEVLRAKAVAALRTMAEFWGVVDAEILSEEELIEQIGVRAPSFTHQESLLVDYTRIGLGYLDVVVASGPPAGTAFLGSSPQELEEAYFSLLSVLYSLSFSTQKGAPGFFLFTMKELFEQQCDAARGAASRGGSAIVRNAYDMLFGSLEQMDFRQLIAFLGSEDLAVLEREIVCKEGYSVEDFAGSLLQIASRFEAAKFLAFGVVGSVLRNLGAVLDEPFVRACHHYFSITSSVIVDSLLPLLVASLTVPNKVEGAMECIESFIPDHGAICRFLKFSKEDEKGLVTGADAVAVKCRQKKGIAAVQNARCDRAREGLAASVSAVVAACGSITVARGVGDSPAVLRYLENEYKQRFLRLMAGGYGVIETDLAVLKKLGALLKECVD